MDMLSVLRKLLYEDEEELDTNNRKKNKEVPKRSNSEKNKEELDMSNSEKEEEDDGVVVSVKLNDNTKGGSGQIKLLGLKKLGGINKIEDLIKLFDINPDNIKNVFKDRMEITIMSPLKEFKDDVYIIRLMHGIGELYIKKGDKINNTITKYGKGTTEEVDLSYLDDLNLEFKQAVKNGLFDRIIGERVK